MSGLQQTDLREGTGIELILAKSVAIAFTMASSKDDMFTTRIAIEKAKRLYGAM